MEGTHSPLRGPFGKSRLNFASDFQGEETKCYSFLVEEGDFSRWIELGLPSVMQDVQPVLGDKRMLAEFGRYLLVSGNPGKSFFLKRRYSLPESWWPSGFPGLREKGFREGEVCKEEKDRGNSALSRVTSIEGRVTSRGECKDSEAGQFASR